MNIFDKKTKLIANGVSKRTEAAECPLNDKSYVSENAKKTELIVNGASKKTEATEGPLNDYTTNSIVNGVSKKTEAAEYPLNDKLKLRARRRQN